MAGRYDDPVRPDPIRSGVQPLQGDDKPIPDSSVPRDGGEGMDKSLAGTPKSALAKGFVKRELDADSDPINYV